MPDLPQSGGSWIRDPKTGALAPNVPPVAEPTPAEPAPEPAPEPAAPTDDGAGADPVPQASGRTRKKG